MGRHAFRMSDKKAKELREEQQRLEREERKRRAEIYAPLFSTKPKIVKIKNTKPVEVLEKRESKPNAMMGLAVKAAPKVYTGDKVLCIATMHKSNIVPIFNREAAVDVARMRRN